MSDSELDQFKVNKDDEGNVLPVEGVSPTLGIEVKVLPLRYGESRQLESFGQPFVNWSSEDKATLLSNNLVEPDLNAEYDDGELTAMRLEEDFEAWFVEDMVQAVGVYSGLKRLFESAEGKAMDQAEAEGLI